MPTVAAWAGTENEGAETNEPLLVKMQQLPPILPCHTPERVPRRARKRLGKVMVDLIGRLMGLLNTAGGAPAEEAIETASLCKMAYALIARRE